MREQQRKHEQAADRSGETEVLVIAPTELGDQKEAVLSHTDSLEDGIGPPGNGSIYYDYDAYNVKEDYQALMEAHGKALLKHKELRLRIEGNCDERGSREYNLALGQRRADSVKRALTLLGVPVSQIETVSFGSEQPKVTGHDEEAYAENRRSDLTYSASRKMRQ